MIKRIKENIGFYLLAAFFIGGLGVVLWGRVFARDEAALVRITVPALSEPAAQFIIARAAQKQVVAVAALELIVALAAIDQMVAGLALDLVPARFAVEGVVAGPAFDLVVA